MIVLVTGGSGSGKSEYAEGRCMELNTGKLLYIATMEPFGAEGERRIARHRKLRAGKGFETLECYTHLEDVSVQAHTTVLLECLSNLTANEMYSQKGRKQEICDWIMKGVKRLAEQAEHLVIVTNEVFSDGICYDASTTEYLQHLACLNSRIAALADQVVEVVHGIPICHSGEKEKKRQ